MRDIQIAWKQKHLAYGLVIKAQLHGSSYWLDCSWSSVRHKVHCTHANWWRSHMPIDKMVLGLIILGIGNTSSHALQKNPKELNHRYQRRILDFLKNNIILIVNCKNKCLVGRIAKIGICRPPKSRPDTYWLSRSRHPTWRAAWLIRQRHTHETAATMGCRPFNSRQVPIGPLGLSGRSRRLCRPKNACRPSRSR